MHAGRLGALLLVVAAVLGGACEPGRTCYEGDFLECECDDGQHGYAACDAANDAFGACGYCGRVPAAVETGCGGADGTGGSSGGKVGFMETCESDEQCETGLCYTFTTKGPHCTKACETASECPCPSPGCNPKGVCKAP